MNGEMRIDASGIDLDKLGLALDEAVPAALAQGAEVIRAASVELVPIETGRLAGSAAVHVDGDQVSISYEGPYARYQHERLDLRHEHGQAKYLEQPMLTEKDKALGVIAREIAARLRA